jgi:sugar/nucleoside kinase (ribokinase family)
VPEILTAGEILVEIMRTGRDMPLGIQGYFSGPFPSGAPAIFIDQAALLGHVAGIVGGVGDDEFGHRILRRLKIDGVDVSCVNINREVSTAVAFVSYNSAGDRTFIYHIDRAAAGFFEIPKTQYLEDVRLFHVMGCSLMASREVRTRINRIAQLVKKNGGLVSFDPNIRVELLRDEKLEDVIGTILHCTDILLPGEKELLSITEKPTIEESVSSILSLGVGCIVLKRGKRGARLFTGKTPVEAKSFRVEEVDPTGAGDAFDAGFLCGWLEGWDPGVCLELAAACGALNASFFGPMEGVFHRNYVDYFVQQQG